METRDRWALAGYFALAGITLGVAEGLRRRGVPPSVTRKLVHVVAGISPLYVTFMARQKWVGLLPYLLTAGMNAAIWRWRLLGSITRAEDTAGIVYFPVSQSMLLAWFWQPTSAASRHPVALAALLTLALADAAAALVGERYGRHPYRVAGSRRSVEGSSAMFLVTALVIALTPRATPAKARSRYALATASIATLAEGLSPRGIDNLVVPLVVAAFLQGVWAKQEH